MYGVLGYFEEENSLSTSFAYTREAILICKEVIKMLKGEDNNTFSFFDKLFSIWLAICLISGFAVYFIIPFPLYTSFSGNRSTDACITKYI